MNKNRKVVVVGAGIAGLGAAYALRKHGLEVTVLEAASRPGGRVIREEVDGFYMDIGANVFLESYGTVRQLAEEIGVPLRRTPVPINGGLYRKGKFHGFYGGDKLGNRLKTARTFLSFQLLSLGGLWQALKFVRMLKARSDDLSFDDHTRMLDLDIEQTTTAFFESKIGTEFLEQFIQPNLSSYTFGYPEEIGVAYAMAAAWNFGLNGVAWPCMPEGGPSVFVEALARACEESIQVSVPVEKIVIENGAARGAITAAGLNEADAVICATTATKALEIMPGLPSGIRDALRKVRYSQCCRVFYGADSSPFPEDWYAVAFPRETGALMTGMSNSAVLAPETVPKGKALIDALVMGEQARELFALSDEYIGQRVLAEIRKYLPAMPHNPLFTRVYRWKEAVCLAPGGMMTALHRMRRRDLASVKGLFLAGEYMGIPSTNGALHSGINAADDCAAFVLRPAT